MEIKVRLFEETDISERVKWINNPLINKAMFFDLPATEEKTFMWFKNKDNAKRVDFTFLDNKENIVCMGGYTSINKVHNNAEFYIMVNPECHGQGIGMKTSIWMYNYAFLTLKLHKIYLYTNDQNISAYKIYENAGFHLEGILKEDKFKNDMFIDRRIYGLLKKEWEIKSWKVNSLLYEL